MNIQSPLRVAVVIDSLTPARWVKLFLIRLADHAHLDVNVVLLDEAPASADSLTSANYLDRLGRWLLSRKIDKPRFTETPLAEQALPESLSVTPMHNSEAALNDSEIIINLTRSTLPTSLSVAAQTPVWNAYANTLNARVHDSLLARSPLIWIYLWSQPYGGGQVEVLALHSLPRQSYSLTDLQNTAWLCLPPLIESRLNWVAAGENPISMENREHFEKQAEFEPDRQAAYRYAMQLSEQGFAPATQTPTLRFYKILQLWFFQTRDRIRNKLFYEQWQLAIMQQDTNALDSVTQLINTAPEDYTAIAMPERTWWADPHLVQRDEHSYVFFENMSIDDDYGHLSVAKLDEHGQAVDIRTVMDDGEHLSYPFVFTHLGNDYMIPETASRRTISLYQATRFPDQWSKLADLLTDVDLADSTLHYTNGRWWMFTNSMTHRCVDERDELRLYHASELTGPWQPHPLNPIVTGIDRARMAGPLIRDGDNLYRVSQYGAHRYGYGINLHKIECLNEQQYRESPAGRILPGKDAAWLGCHTMSQQNGITVLDRVTRRRR